MFAPRSSAEYDLLPSSERGGSGKQLPLAVRASRFLRHRRVVVTLVSILVGGIVLVLYFVTFRATELPWQISKGDPPGEALSSVVIPLYPEYHRAELQLPQHANRRPFANGQKYLWVADHVQSSGWGNFMQDMMLSAQLVYETGRSFVFDNYTWDRDGGDYAEWNGHKIPSRIPFSAMISGPIVGGPFADGDNTPRAIIKQYWDQICPNKTVIRADEIRKLHGEGADARHIIDTYVAYINNIEDPCVEVERHSGSIFHIFMFGTPREILPIWPTFSKSPILQLFGWGTPAHEAFAANRHLFSPPPLIESYVTSPSCLNCVDPYEPLDGLLALHLRRGDFIEHCVNLGHWGAGFNAFNAFPDFVDPWVPPQGEDEERMAVYLRRCLPTVEQIVEKVESVRQARSGEGLKNIYIMSNGDEAWLGELKAALRRSWNWELIATSRDLLLTPEQKFVSQTLDMFIGERAQVVIGNGFSSMTSNIAMLRQARQRPADSTRMW